MKKSVQAITMLMIMLSATSSWAIGGLVIRTNISDSGPVRIESCNFNYINDNPAVIFNRDIVKYDSNYKPFLQAKENTEYRAVGLVKAVRTDKWLQDETIAFVRYIGEDNEEHRARPNQLSTKSAMDIESWVCRAENMETLDYIAP